MNAVGYAAVTDALDDAEQMRRVGATTVAAGGCLCGASTPNGCLVGA